MNEIKCPHCGKMFQIDASEYESIVKQIRDNEFNKEIKANKDQYEREKEDAKKLFEERLKNKEVETQSRIEKEYLEKLKENELDIEKLRNQIEKQETEKELAIKDAVAEKDKKLQELNNKFEKEYSDKLKQNELELEKLRNQIEKQETEKELAIKDVMAEKDKQLHELRSKFEKEYSGKLNYNELELEKLKSQIEKQETEKELAIKNAVTEKDKKISELTNELEISKKELLVQEKNLKENYEEKIKDKDEQIAYYKDFKAKQSTKMIGESLEQHCSDEFNKLRPLFLNAYFEKDNNVKTGSKGDFIFRDYDEEGDEIVSIMFEMKNEADMTATKHKNEDFFKELDKDRNEKKCEYAVLVSLLEAESDYYNEGIVDVSYRYEKMYVIRPQFFIPIITLIRGLALNSLKYKKELALVKTENVDISNFEENMNKFKESFGRNYRLASDKFRKAIEEIDKTIEHLQKTKDNLVLSDKNLRIANDKAEELTIKKLTKNNKTMANMFAKVKDKNEIEKIETTLNGETIKEGKINVKEEKPNEDTDLVDVFAEL